jgi:dTDP-4-dehydrorhamnose 3,5-epimerase
LGVAWNDPAIGIVWPVAQPVLSERDRNNQPLASLLDWLPVWNAEGS